MKFLKSFFGLFFALYIPFLVVGAIVLKPKDPTMTPMQAAMASALPFAVIMGVIALGYATLSHFMDAEKVAREKAEAAQKAASAPKKKKRNK